MGTYCLVAGGGTAGHLVPGLVVADELVRRGHRPDELHFVVSERPIDQQLLEETSFVWTTLPGRGIQRRLTLANLGAAWGLVRAGFGALRVMRRERPRVVLAVGGYASLACAIAAVVCRVPLVVAEQNARAGAANRVVGRFARACAVPFGSTDLPRAVVTGNPVRTEVLAVDRQRDRVSAREALGLAADRTVILAFAGSLGSGRVNDAVLGVADAWRDRDDVAIHHSVGSRDWDGLQPAIAGLEGANIQYHAVAYEDRMHLAMAAADVAVCRSGGTTVAEVAVVGLPSILVPLPIAPRDHQTANARELVDAGAACLVPDGDLTTRRLLAELAAIVDDPVHRRSMASAAAALGRRDASGRVADLIEEHAR
jgi:UDP-N-acetylglucosamine--N-acetylmuramyl-(pentapeptide) pyrophosphoryl-undecaprenol N-acetylglucosamine transferase